ncbi:arylsulfatase [Iamia majanohamensis]|uniref:Arylsulfatase n=1 Tax=Iamia majanohamensis TaxID=467976 RepID=A0AAE9Y3H2_9ACTN|nr:arylsulfatase [Iamia majanohamensis]WCO65322.1 arylsulfatase [Iamia majanohamensis]
MTEQPTDAAARRTYPGFGGLVGRTFAGSEPWWPERPSSAGRPNVIVILADDLGYADLGCYGSEIRTPNLDRLAAGGLQLTDFHSTPMCSPTRASLLTGIDPHAVGVGTVAHSDPGFPGYAMELASDVATAAEIYRGNGYFTAMVGKWHLAKDSDQNDAGPRHSWPCQRGFDRYYGFLDGFTNLHHPHRLIEDNHAVEVDQYPDDYYFTDDMTDRAIGMLKASKAAAPDRPFFLYMAHGAVHAPLHAKADDIARYRGRYDAGWDALREERFARMQELGIVGPDVTMAPRNTEPGNDVAPWDELSDGQRRLAARYMEIYAAMVDNIDQNTGRLLDALEAMGELDDTIIVFTSDNGASREGEVDGTASYYVHLLNETDVEVDLARLDEMGGPTTTPHYPRGWAMAGNTPFRLYKINAHAGGHTVPFLLHGPVPGEPGTLRRPYQHITDLLPTLLELCGLDHPSQAEGAVVRPPQGTSFAPVLADPEHPSTHPEQLTEMIGQRGYRLGEMEAVTLHQPLTPFDEGEWELYDMAADPTQLHDLAAEQPEVLADLVARWEEGAWAGRVYPLDEGSQVKYLIRPPSQATYEAPVTLLPGTPTLERWRSLQLLFLRSVAITVRVVVGPDDEGILVAHGDQGGGYALWLDGDGLHLAHNDGCGRMRQIDGPRPEPGSRELRVELDAPGGGVWDALLRIDGELVASEAGWPCLYAMAPFEGIDVGLDRRSPVVWRLYQEHGCYPYTGHITSVTYEPGARPPDSPANLIPMLQEMGKKFE